MMTLELARQTLGESGKVMSDNEIVQVVSLFQSLADNWLDRFEKTTFEGKTIKQLLTAGERTSLL